MVTVVADGGEPIELLRATYQRQTFAPHAHDAWAVGALEAGACRMRHGGAEHRLRPGGVIAIAPGETHTGAPDGADGWRYRMLYLPAHALDGARFASPFVPDAALAADVLHAHRELERQGGGLRGHELLADVLARLVARHGLSRGLPDERAARMPAAVRLVRDHLHAHHARPIALGDLARLAGLSPFHLIRVFRRAVGMPPYTYLEHVRVQRAQAMLRAGEPTSRVAYATGFSDQSHFTRRFKRVVGVPPGQYARAHAVARRADAARGVA